MSLIMCLFWPFIAMLAVTFTVISCLFVILWLEQYMHPMLAITIFGTVFFTIVIYSMVN